MNRIIATVSANSGGCKNRADDPNAAKAGYTAAMDPFCRNKRAGAAFFWLTFSQFIPPSKKPTSDKNPIVVWTISLASILKTWYAVRTNPQSSAFLIPNEDGTDTFIADSHQHEMEQQDQFYAPPPPGVTSSGGGGGYRASGDYYGTDRIFSNERDPEGYRNPRTGVGRGGEFIEAREVYRPRMEDPFDPPTPGWDRETALREADPYERIRQSMEVNSAPSGESQRRY